VPELDEIQKLGAAILRPEHRMSDEDLIASEMAAAVLASPLEKIRHTVEALYMLNEEERRAAEISEEEELLANRIYTLALALKNVHIEMLPSGEACVRIVWPFPSSEANTWLSWASGPIIYFPSDMNLPENLPLPQKIYHWTTRGIPKESYEALVVRFARFAMPIAMRLMRKIMVLVSPDSYKQALAILGGGRRHGGKA
jgi:hypothetical protein